MKRIIIAVLFLLPFLVNAQSINNQRIRWMQPFWFGGNDTTGYKTAVDTSVMLFNRSDSTLYIRYKGSYRPLAFVGMSYASDSLIYATRARLYKVRDSLISASNTWTGKNTFNDTIITNKEVIINDGVGRLKVGQELVEALSSGLVSGGNLTIGSPTTTFSVSSGEGHVVNNTTKRYKEVVWSAFNNQTVTVSAPIVHILIDSNGAIVQQSTVPTRAQRRSQIYIGYVAISGGTVIAATPSSQVVSQPVNQSYDFFDAFGPFNVSGNLLTAAGTNMNVNKSSGTIFKAGSNFQTDSNDPNVKSQSAATPLTFQYCTSAAGSSTGTNTTTFTGANYDNGGTITAIPGSSNQATIQRIFLYPTGTVRVQYGPTIYNSLANALAAVNTESFTPNPSFSGTAILLGYVVLTKGATALNDPTNAKVLQASRFGDIASSAGNTAVIDSIRLENTGVLHVSPAAFSVSGTTGVVTQTLANQSPFTVFRRGSGTGTPSFGSIDSSYFGNTFATQVRGVGDSRYGLLGTANTWTAKNTFTDSIVGVNQRLTGTLSVSNDLILANFSDRVRIQSFSGKPLYINELGNNVIFGGTTSLTVGINTTNPIRTFQVENSDGNLVRLRNKLTSNNSYASIELTTEGGGNAQIRGYQESSTASYLSLFARGTSDGVGERVRVNGTGRVLIGQTIPTDDGSNILQVNGGIRATGALTATAQGNNIAVTVDSTTITTSGYTLVLGDAGKFFRIKNGSTALTVTIPANSSVAFPVGTLIGIQQQGTAQITIAGASGVQIESEGSLTKTAGLNAGIYLMKTSGDIWLLVGNRG